MRITLLAFLSLIALVHSAPAESKHWRELLTQPVDDEWQQVFGTSIFQQHARPAETVAEKISAVQALIARSNEQGITIPVFLPPSFAAWHCGPIPATPKEAARTGVPLTRVPAIEVFRHVAALVGCCAIETEHGIILKPDREIAAERPSQPFVPEGWDRFQPHQSMLSDAVCAADVIFTGITTQVDPTHYDGIKGKGTYSADITPQTFLKGQLTQQQLNLTWEPSASGIKPGSNHIFFIQTTNDGFKVVKEIYVHQSPMWSQTYWAYNGGTEATLQTIRLLVTPSQPLPGYPATLMADLKQDKGDRQATAVMLACETLRPECLAPLLFAVANQAWDYIHAVYGACRLDGEQGARAALALLASHSDKQYEIFDAISAAKNTKSVPILDQFGTDHPDYRVSCAFAIREIDPTQLPDAVRRWRADGKHKEIFHKLDLNLGRLTATLSADSLLEHALAGKKVFDER